MSIKAVVFDHGGVLTRGGGAGTNEKAASAAMGLDEVIDIPDINEALKCGRITNQQYVDEINVRFPDAPYRLTMAVWSAIYAELVPDLAAYRFVQRCREAGLRTAMLSSVNVTIAEMLQQDGSYDGFMPLVLSCYRGCAKPDPEIYRLTEAALELSAGIHPHELLFLDDQEKCCEAARRRAWEAIRVDSTEQMIADASALLGL